MNNKPIFGMSGFSPLFWSSSLKKNRDNIFKWTKEFGIDGVELQCTYGIRMPEEQAIRYKALAKEYGIYLSMHAPYYVSLASLKADVVERSKLEIKKAFKLASLLGISRIIFHPGGGYGADRESGIKRLCNALNSIESGIDTKNIKIYPEIGGKVNQLGSLEEIIEICKNVKYARPCIDFAHLHARELGSMTSSTKMIEVMKRIENELGRKVLEETHFHVYPVDFNASGEKSHKVFGEKKNDDQISLFNEGVEYMPKAEDYIKAIKEMKLKPITICEAHNTQDTGAKLMKDLYFE